MKRSKTPETSADRHAFNALYGFACDCDDCASPKQKALKQELARHLRAAPKEDV